jgi:hypothetical protein
MFVPLVIEPAPKTAAAAAAASSAACLCLLLRRWRRAAGPAIVHMLVLLILFCVAAAAAAAISPSSELLASALLDLLGAALPSSPGNQSVDLLQLLVLCIFKAAPHLHLILLLPFICFQRGVGVCAA